MPDGYALIRRRGEFLKAPNPNRAFLQRVCLRRSPDLYTAFQTVRQTLHRMELKKLKARLDTAVRGHKLLKDKSDEMVRRFSVIIKENKFLRDEVEKELAETLKQFSVARSVTPSYRAETAFAMPSVAVKADCLTQSVMGVDVPKLFTTRK